MEMFLRREYSGNPWSWIRTIGDPTAVNQREPEELNTLTLSSTLMPELFSVAAQAQRRAINGNIISLMVEQGSAQQMNRCFSLWYYSSSSNMGESGLDLNYNSYCIGKKDTCSVYLLSDTMSTRATGHK